MAVGFVDLGGLAAACMLWPDDDDDDDAAGRGAATAKSGAPSKRGSGGSGSSAGGSNGGPPLRWVGYDSSAYAVAKSLVVAEMIQQVQQQPAAAGGAEMIDHILQVWYSSAWTRAALAAFRTALTAVLSRAGPAAAGGGGGGGGSGGLPPAVMDLLRHWQLRDVPLRQARSEWLGSLSRSESYIGNFKEKVRR